MNVSARRHDRLYLAGKIVDVPDDYAKDLVAARFAIPVDKEKAVWVAAVPAAKRETPSRSKRETR